MEIFKIQMSVLTATFQKVLIVPEHCLGLGLFSSGSLYQEFVRDIVINFPNLTQVQYQL